jgi:EmrB/QacA subfamily drug resistance transporter
MTASAASATPAPTGPPPVTPAHAALVLVALIMGATVANLNLAVANVALPDIGAAFDASQTQLNLVAVSYSLGLAASVLYLGAVGDRYGRKLMLLLGVALSVPACLLAAWAPSIEMLIAARLLGGLSAGMAYPTTLALITALWAGAPRTKAIALWSAVGGAMAAIGPLVAGFLLGEFWWGSVFLVTLPLAAIAFVLAARSVPAHVNETDDAVDHLGGVMSIIAVATLVIGISFAPEPGEAAVAAALLAVAVLATAAFVVRQRRAPNPLYDLDIAARRIFWVAAVGGIVVFGSLMGAMFVGQQYLQNVLGYSTLEAGASILPAAVFMVIVAPRSAHLVETRGARFTLLVGYVSCFLGFVTMLVLWTDHSAYWQVALAYSLVGIGVGFAGTPASHSLTSSVPVDRAGMASGTADLQRDLGGAILQSILGALLTAGYAAAFSAEIAASPQASQVSETTQSQLLRSYSSAEATAEQFPQYADQITTAAREAFTQGQNWAYLAGAVAIALGAVLVAVMFPRHDDERRLLAEYAAQDAR